jgi:aspartate ammonia-lyase
MDPTQNCDVFAEVSGLLKASAVNLTKIANDLRLLSSGPSAGIGEIVLPPFRRAPPSCREGKPVICEGGQPGGVSVMADDFGRDPLRAGDGQLELNAFLPLIAKNLLTCSTCFAMYCHLYERCIRGIVANRRTALKKRPKAIRWPPR